MTAWAGGTAAAEVGIIADVTTRDGGGGTGRRRIARPRSLLAAAALGVLAILALPAAPASAHAVLTATNPAKGSVVTDAPTTVVLVFTEPVDPVEGKVRIIAPDGSRADGGEPSADGTRLSIPMRTDPPRGTYLVSYRVLSQDSHPVTGSFTFSIGAPSPGGPPTDNASGTASSYITTVFPMVRWVGYVGLLLLVGATLVLALLWPKRFDRRGPIRFIWIGAALIAVATIGEMVLQVPYIVGGGLGDINTANVKEILSTQFGAAHLVRLGVLGAALVLLRPIARGAGWGADRVLLAVLGTIGVATWSVSGHPSASPVPMVSVVADMVHLTSMSVWLGGLAMLIVFLLPKANASELGVIVPLWSRWATYAVSALVLTGVAQALIEVGTPKALVTTRYGWTIITKVGLVALVLSVAFLSRRLVNPVAEKDPTAPRRLRAVVIAEAAIAALVLATTSVLVQTPPARSVAAESFAPQVVSVTVRTRLWTLTADVVPARAGLNDVHLYATQPDGQLADIKEWVVKAELPSQGIESIEASVLVLTPDHATGQIALPAAGTWRFSFTLRTSEVDQSTATADVVIRS